MKRYLAIFLSLIISLCFFGFNVMEKDSSSAYGQSGRVKGRDPFLLPPGVKILGLGKEEKQVKQEIKKESFPSRPAEEPSPIKGAESSPPSLSLKAILISDRLRLAAIDERIVSIGEVIEGEKILQIQEDRVVLSHGDKRRTLYLPQSSVPLSVEEK